MKYVQFCYISRDCTLTDYIICTAFQKYDATQKMAQHLNTCLACLNLQFLQNFHLLVQVYDLVHDRTNKINCAPSEYSDQLLHEPG